MNYTPKEVAITIIARDHNVCIFNIAAINCGLNLKLLNERHVPKTLSESAGLKEEEDELVLLLQTPLVRIQR